MLYIYILKMLLDGDYKANTYIRLYLSYFYCKQNQLLWTWIAFWNWFIEQIMTNVFFKNKLYLISNYWLIWNKIDRHAYCVMYNVPFYNYVYNKCNTKILEKRLYYQ